MKNLRHSKQDFLKSSPHFFRLILAALAIFTILAICGAILLPAPLQGPADIASPPNPSKSAWFLLWVQELVSHGTILIYGVLAAGLLFVLLPWLPLHSPLWRASWFSRRQWAVNLLTVAFLLTIITLSIIAACFRGPQWHFTYPF
jgi:hypothetical protein